MPMIPAHLRERNIGPPFKILSTCKGGGYKYCRTEPQHPKANSKGLYPLHRVLMENKLGRLLTDEEDVHHKDEDKTNDEVDNLEVLSHSGHARHHRPIANRIECHCPCGAVFHLYPHQFRLRMKREKGGRIYCSRPCQHTHGKPY